MKLKVLLSALFLTLTLVSYSESKAQFVYLDKYGKVYFSEGLARVERDGKYGFIDKTGQEVITLKYDDTGLFFSDGLARVELNGKWGFIDKRGKEVIPFKYDYAKDYGEHLSDLAAVELNGKWGFIKFIKRKVKEITPLKYDDVGSFSEGLARVKLNGKRVI